LLIGGGILIAIFASWYVCGSYPTQQVNSRIYRLVYTLVQKHIRSLSGISPEIDELAAEAVEDAEEDAPLLNSSSV
jgi:hypothetical protein